MTVSATLLEVLRAASWPEAEGADPVGAENRGALLDAVEKAVATYDRSRIVGGNSARKWRVRDFRDAHVFGALAEGLAARADIAAVDLGDDAQRIEAVINDDGDADHGA
jgi:hypothetical protein